MTKHEITEGKSYLMFVPPGWILVGRVVQDEGIEITLDTACWIESLQSKSSIADLAGQKPKVRKIVSRSLGIPALVTIRREAIFLRYEVSFETAKALAGDTALKALEEAK